MCSVPVAVNLRIRCKGCRRLSSRHVVLAQPRDHEVFQLCHIASVVVAVVEAGATAAADATAEVDASVVIAATDALMLLTVAAVAPNAGARGVEDPSVDQWLQSVCLDLEECVGFVLLSVFQLVAAAGAAVAAVVDWKLHP